MSATEMPVESESRPKYHIANPLKTRKTHPTTTCSSSHPKRVYVLSRAILSSDSVLPTWGRQQSAAVESYEESFSALEDKDFMGSYIQDESSDLPAVLIISGDPGLRCSAADRKSAFTTFVSHTLVDVFSEIKSESLDRLYASLRKSRDSIEKIRQLRFWLANAELQIAGLLDVRFDTTVLEQFTGFVDYIEGPTAFVTLTTDAGEELAGEYSADEFAKLGIRENRRFICQTVIEDGKVEVRFQPISDIEVTPEEEKVIDQRLDELISGCELDGDY